MIHHATIEVSFDKVQDEFKFWEALGYKRVENPDTHSIVYWMQAEDGSQVHLFPKLQSRVMLSEFGHFAICPEDGLSPVIKAIGNLKFPVVIDEGTRYWGARRVFVFSPTGQRVELMERTP